MISINVSFVFLFLGGCESRDLVKSIGEEKKDIF